MAELDLRARADSDSKPKSCGVSIDRIGRSVKIDVEQDVTAFECVYSGITSAWVRGLR